MARSTAHFVRASVCAESGRWDGVGRASSDVEKMRRARARPRATFVARNRLGDNYAQHSRDIEAMKGDPHVLYKCIVCKLSFTAPLTVSLNIPARDTGIRRRTAGAYGRGRHVAVDLRMCQSVALSMERLILLT